jgi:site-specific recombinase XerD
MEITASVVDKSIAEEEEQMNKTERAKKKTTLLNDLWDYISKKKEIKHQEDLERGLNRKLHPTVKDYISTYYAIKDYEHFSHSKTRLSDITEEWMDNFIEFLGQPHVNSKTYKYTCRGNMCNKTANKRLDCFANFVWRYYKDVDKADVVKSKKLDDSIKSDILRLYKDELTKLADMPLTDADEIRIRDYFVFICLTGLRFSDFSTIDKTNFIYNGKFWVLRLFTQKTVKKAEIPLTDRAYAIALKYGYRFDLYNNQIFNKRLKSFLKNHELFGESYLSVRHIRRRLERNTVKRRDKMSAHTGRRTFISILIESGVSVNRVMAMTGHTNESTLKIYVDKFSPDLHESIEPLSF